MTQNGERTLFVGFGNSGNLGPVGRADFEEELKGLLSRHGLQFRRAEWGTDPKDAQTVYKLIDAQTIYKLIEDLSRKFQDARDDAHSAESNASDALYAMDEADRLLDKLHQALGVE